MNCPHGIPRPMPCRTCDGRPKEPEKVITRAQIEPLLEQARVDWREANDALKECTDIVDIENYKVDRAFAQGQRFALQELLKLTN